MSSGTGEAQPPAKKGVEVRMELESSGEDSHHGEGTRCSLEIWQRMAQRHRGL